MRMVFVNDDIIPNLDDSGRIHQLTLGGVYEVDIEGVSPFGWGIVKNNKGVLYVFCIFRFMPLWLCRKEKLDKIL